jgi:hypothetical protein
MMQDLRDRVAVRLERVLAAAFLVAVTLAVATPAQAVAEARAEPRLLAEVEHEYRTMTVTRYQHHTQVDATAGRYFYDCVGFVAHALRESDPTAIATVRRLFAITPNRVPAPARFVAVFTATGPEPAGWQRVTRLADARPGDVLAWSYDHPARSNGHAAVLASTPRPGGRDSYLVDVWDSTATPHGPHDTRIANPVNLPAANGQASGLGRGTIRVDVDHRSGSVRAVHWTPTSGAVAAAHFGLGRPTS